MGCPMNCPRFRARRRISCSNAPPVRLIEQLLHTKRRRGLRGSLHAKSAHLLASCAEVPHLPCTRFALSLEKLPPFPSTSSSMVDAHYIILMPTLNRLSCAAAALLLVTALLLSPSSVARQLKDCVVGGTASATAAGRTSSVSSIVNAAVDRTVAACRGSPTAPACTTAVTASARVGSCGATLS